jgi:hypothetical protein
VSDAPLPSVDDLIGGGFAEVRDGETITPAIRPADPVK